MKNSGQSRELLWFFIDMGVLLIADIGIVLCLVLIAA